jgi:RNA polymerase sigma factor (sigma-70 family)
MPETTSLLRMFGSGDEQARAALLLHAQERLRLRASQMLRSYPVVKRWEDTDDVLQNALIRLNTALSAVPLQSPRHFWNLAALQLRRTLLDLADRYKAVPALGMKHDTDDLGKAADDPGGAFDRHAGRTKEPESLEDWTRFHEAVASLPEEEHEVFSLKWYGGLTLDEVAQEIGVSLRTVKRRWRDARLLLDKALADNPPHQDHP